MEQPDYAELVRQRRAEMGMTQLQLAEKAGVSPRSVQNLEARTTKPQPNKLRAILRAVGVDEGGEEIAEVTRSSWRPSTQVALDMLGAYLDSLPEDEAVEVIADLTRQIFTARRSNG